MLQLPRVLSRRSALQRLALLAGATFSPWRVVGAEAKPETDALGPLLPRRTLGQTGLKVTMLACGGSHIGRPSEATAQAVIEAAIERGVRVFDTAQLYQNGGSEERLGRYLTPKYRAQVLVFTKTMAEDARTAREHLDGSLRRLKTDYLDLYYLHGPDPVAPIEETLRAYDDLVRQGKVRYVGVSNLFGWQIAKAAGITARLGLGALVAGQYIYSPIHRELEREVIPSAVDSGIGITCYGVFGAGLLAGKYKGMTEPNQGSRMQIRMQMDGARFWHPRGFRAAQAIEGVSEKTGIPMAKLAIGWPLGRKFVSSVVLGIRTREQMLANLEAADWDMPQDAWKAIEEQTRPEEDNLTWFNRQNYQRIFAVAEFHDERADLV